MILNKLPSLKWLVIGGALIYSVFHILLDQYGMISDIHMDYISIVQNLLEGGGWVFPDGSVANRYPPLFPVSLYLQHGLSHFLGIRPVWITSACSIAQITLCGTLLAKMGTRLTNNSMVGKISFLLYMSCPYVFYSSMKPLSLVPYSIVTYSAVYLLILACQKGLSPKRLIIIGFLLGVGNLIRPIGILVPFIFGICLVLLWFFNRATFSLARIAFSGGLIVAVAYVTILPWSLFQMSKSGEWALLSTGGLRSIKDGLSFNYKKHRVPLELGEGVSELVTEFTAQYKSYQKGEDVGLFLLEKLKNEPMSVLELAGLKLVRTWYGTDSQNPKYELVNKLVSIIYLVLFIVALFYHYSIRDDAWVLFLCVLFLLIFYYWGMTLLVLSIVRYMIPILGLMMVVMANGIIKALQKRYASFTES